MQVNRQKCQACGSIDVRNLIARECDKATMVYVRCAGCGELVARFEVSNLIDRGECLEWYLRTHGVAAGDSAREWLTEFRRLQEDAVVGFEAALEELKQTEENA